MVLLFSLPVLGLLGIPLFSATWQSVRQGLVSTDALLSLGVGAAFASSFLAVLKGDGNVYFEVGCVILVMTALGRWLEVEGRLKATEALDALASLLPAHGAASRLAAGGRTGAARPGEDGRRAARLAR